MSDRYRQQQVRPGDLQEFATLVEKLQDDWNSEAHGPMRLANSEANGEYPVFGQEFQAGSTLQSAYDQAHGRAVDMVQDVYETLGALAAASRQIAETYQASEELASADVTKVEDILLDHMNPSQDTPGSPGSQSGVQQG